MNTHDTAILQGETSSAEQTVAFGVRLGQRLKCGDVVALDGMLGAGKTQLVRGIVEGLGGNGRCVASPTFVLMSEYAADVPVIHIDAYRIEGLSDLETLGWTDELMMQSVTLIEWAGRLGDELPESALHVQLEHAAEPQTRRLTLHGEADWPRRLAGLQLADPGTTVCSICGQATGETGRYFPFCSERCRLVDLGRWFGGEYRIGGNPDPDPGPDAETTP